MHTKLILRIVGLLLMVFSLTLIPPILIALVYQDGGLDDFIKSMIGLFLLGVIMWYPTRNNHHELKIRDGFLIVVIFWTALGFAGAIPMYFASNTFMPPTDAIFESFSALTTTGATVLTSLDTLPHAILWYRQQLQWLGGMGIIVLAVAILPMLGIGGMQLYRAEAPGPVKDSKLAPRISETAKALWLIYLGLTLACAFAYWVAGMNWFDAFAHSFSTVAIGGFSTHDLSIGYYNNVDIEIVAMVFMYLAGINFALHFTAFRNMSNRPYLSDPEFKVYTGILLIGIAISTLYLHYKGFYSDWTESLRYAAFQTISIATTTGFTNAEFAIWPAFLPVMFIFMSFIGGSAGSTAGGMKVIRFILLAKQGSREIKRLLHPNAIMPVKLNGKAVPDRVISAVWGFFSLYVVSFIGLMVLLMMLGMDQVTAFSAVAATINNLGPGLGDVSTNYQTLTSPMKWVLTFAMLLGRLEIFTLLVLFTAAFWRK
ncbi:TrkH family potassium uptake protein [Hydrogenovibrio kuenenii]|uniref:TrkH family potassium uptake protein n=1 Tax=Hydrogenovibrio kuenenii TaxID=63658 RepID=UPI000464950A|nr:TrkH family potassium uptake protein [Hydrogenovibrio kuenenii]